MSPMEFEDITLRQFLNKKTGYENLRKIADQNEWERVRWHAFHVIQNKRRNAKLTDLALFPWEEDEKMDAEAQVKRGHEMAKKWAGGSKPNKKMII